MQNTRNDSFINRSLLDKRRRQLRKAISLLLSAAIVLSVCLNLMQPANTMTTICGKEEHTHSASCYTQLLNCDQDGVEGHVHSADCYTSVLTCGLEEHVHTAACYPQATPAPTVNPEPAAEPEPTVTEAPAEPELPAETETPSEPETPAETEAPAEPIETEAPSETEAPAATPAPEGTETPVDPVDPVDPTDPVDPIETTEPEITPEPELTPEPTPVPEVKVESLSVNPGSVLVGEAATWTFVAANAVELRYVLTKDGAELSHGAMSVEETAYNFTAKEPGDYEFTLTAVGENGMTDSRTSKLHVAAPTDLVIKVSADQRAVLGGAEASFTIESPAARAENVTWQIIVRQGDTIIYEAREFHAKVTVTTQKVEEVTDLTITVHAEDTLGRKADAEATISCGVNDIETRAQWEDTMKDVVLTGVWPDDLVAIAESQVGYHESTVNFIVRADGSVQGWSRYGAFHGCPYEEWCAFFVSYCLYYAQVPSSVIPRYGNCQRWVDALSGIGLYESSKTAQPRYGDIIFFDWQNDGHVDHVGIYISTDEDGTVHTLEGNHNKGVGFNTFKPGDTRIVGYGLVNYAYDVYSGRQAELTELVCEGEEYTVTASYGPEAKVPVGTELEVVEIVRLTPEYAEYSPLISEKMDADWQEAQGLRKLLRVRLVKDGEEVIPEDRIDIKVTFREPWEQEDDATVRAYNVILRDPKIVERDEKDKSLYRVEELIADIGTTEAFEFESVTFPAEQPRTESERQTNMYAVVETKAMAYKELSAEADGYELTMLYPREASLPDTAVMEARHIETDTEEYAALTEATDDQLYKTLEESLTRKAYFEIKLFDEIYDADGELVERVEIIPAQPVQLRVKLPEAVLETAGVELRAFRYVDGEAQSLGLEYEHPALNADVEPVEYDETRIESVLIPAEDTGIYGVAAAQAIGEKTQTVEGDGYLVTVRYDADARVPRKAELQATAIELSEEENTALADELFANYDAELTYARDLQIAFVENGEAAALEAPVQVTVRLEGLGEGELNLAKGGDLTDTEKAEAIDGAFAFEADELNGDVLRAYQAEALAYEAGELGYEDEHSRIQVRYGEEAKIPVGTELVVREIEEGTEEYEKYAAATLEALGEGEELSEEAETRETQRFYDITLTYKGRELEPTDAVQVEIVLTDEIVDALDVIHELTDETIEVPEVSLAETETGEVSATFETESFSVYGVRARHALRTYTIADSGETYSITVTYDEDAGIPADAELAVREITEADEEYAEYKAQMDAALGLGAAEPALEGEDAEEADSEAETADEDETEQPEIRKRARFFDITILAGGEEIEPLQPVQVEITLVGEVTDALRVVHAGEAGTEEITGVEVNSDLAEEITASFAADSFSVYGVYTEHTLRTYTLGADGETYEIVVTYDEEAGIPETAQLAVREILEGTEEYETYLAASREALGLDTDDAAAAEAEAGEAMPETETEETEAVEEAEEAAEQPEIRTHARFFDIAFMDGETEIEPLKPVRVEIRLAMGIVDELRVVHADETDGLEITEIRDVKLKDAAEDEAAMAFTADSFSVYGFVATHELRTYVQTESGETYEITVRYDEDAKLPETAALKVREIEPGTEEYEKYLNASTEALGLNAAEAEAAEIAEETDETEETEEAPAEIRTNARFFDIAFMDGETELEPQDAVEVEIRLLGDIVDEMQVVHATEDEEAGLTIDAIEGVSLETNQEDEATMTFAADSFSVYGFVATHALRTYVISANGETYEITVTFDEDAGIPKDAELTANEILPETAEYEEYLDQANAGLYADWQTAGDLARFFDLAIVKDGERLTPAKPVAVEVKVALPVREAAEDVTEDRVENVNEAEAGELKALRVIEDGVEFIDAMAKPSETAGQIAFDAAELQVYGVVNALTLETKVIDANGDTWKIQVNYGPEAEIPEGAELTASEILPESEAYAEYMEKTDELLLTEQSQKATYARYFDITILKDGAKVEPAAPVEVSITLDEPAPVEADAGLRAVHFAEEGAELLEAAATTAEAVEDAEEQGPAGEVVTFAAEGFSVYGVVYTVDFHYTVNGQEYEFSIPGGGFVSLAHIVEALGLAQAEPEEESVEAASEAPVESEEGILDDGAADVEVVLPEADAAAEVWTSIYDQAADLNRLPVGDAAKKLVADVVRVEFTSPDLVWIGKVDADTTVGALKEGNGLEVQYSAELTEEQITAINAQSVEAGDWALISVLPFESEETLTVTMKNGDQWTVMVTDAQLSTHVITADGEDYLITVTYGPEAEIPDGATLTARELVKGTEEYQQYYEEALQALNLTEAMEGIEEDGFVQSVVQVRFFDITIYAGEKEIEPNAPVSVEITYQGQAYSAYQAVSVVHFAESGLETIDPVASGKGNDTIISFEQESFSVTGTVVNQTNIVNGEYYIIHQDGENWYALASDGSYVDVTANYDNASSSVVDYDGMKNITWHVSSTGDNYYNIKAVGEEKYITLNGSVVGNSFGAVSIHSGTSESPKNAWITRDVTTDVYFGFNNYPTHYRYHATALGWNYGFSINNNDLWLQLNPWNGRTYYMGGREASGTNVQFAKLSTNSGELGGNYPNKTYNIDQLETWLQQAMTDDPIQETSKTASVYDYDNRIYQIDLSTKSGVLGMASDISLAFVTDVSNSMLFPASLTEVSGKIGIKLNSSNLNSLPHNNGEVYFTIADKNSSSTVFALYYDNGWKALDASYYAKWRGTGVSPDSAHSAVTIGSSDTYLRTDPSSTYYTIYTANDGYISGLDSHNIYDMTQGNMGNRLYYLEQSIADSVSDLKSIAAKYPLGGIYTALETFAGKDANQAVKARINYLQIGGYSANMAQANQTYNNNYNTLYNALSHITTADGTMQNVALSDTTFFGNPPGTGGYIGSNGAEQKYVILVTDGAPNGTGANVDSVVAAAKTLRANGVNVITIGLSIEDVTNADRMLYWAASAMDSNGNIVTNPYTPNDLTTVPSANADKRLFYWAKNGEDLTWIMREIVRTVMREAVVSTTIKDEISEVFYPVSEDGTPLNDGDWIKADGTKCSSSDPNRAGKITCTNGKYTVEWKDQDATWTGWSGKVYVKAREDFLGGNNITTNDYCSFTPTKYTTNKGTSNEKSAPFSAADQEAKKVVAATPCVNVDELHMTANSTDFTVYLGTEVDPATELTKLWNEIKVIEVVKEDGTESDYRIDDKGSMYYPTDGANKASKDDIYPQSGYDSIPLSHYDLDQTILTGLLTDIKNSNSATSDPIAYAPYDQGKVGTITVTLTKSVNSEAQGKAPDPHDTEAVSTTSTTPVERYTLTVTYTPLPAEGDSETENRKDKLIELGRVLATDADYKHNGENGPGNETDESSSSNIHRIFVFAKALMVYKKDEAFARSLSGAEFKLYRTAATDDPEESKVSLDGLDGKYVLVSALDNLEEIYKEYGIEEGYEGIFATDYLKLLKDGGQYYLVESKAPTGYIAGQPIPITITVNDMYAPVPPGYPYSTDKPETNLYNLEQEAQLTMTGSNAHLATATGDDIHGTGISPNHASDTAYYLIANNPGVSLPATGGPGLTLFYLAGLALVTLSLGGLAVSARRRRRADAQR